MIDRAKVGLLRNDLVSFLSLHCDRNSRSVDYLISFIEQYCSDDSEIPLIDLDAKRKMIRHLNRLWNSLPFQSWMGLYNIM